MSSLESLAKLSAHGLVITGEGFGGAPNLTALEIAAALGMGHLNRAAYLLGMLKFAGDHGSLGPLSRITRGHVYAIGKAERWNLTDEQIIGLADLAIFESLHSPVCATCNGSRVVAAKPCPQCEGVGRTPLSGRLQATVSGIPETTWRRGWEVRARRIGIVLREWELDLAEHLRKHVGEY